MTSKPADSARDTAYLPRWSTGTLVWMTITAAAVFIALVAVAHAVPLGQKPLDGAGERVSTTQQQDVRMQGP